MPEQAASDEQMSALTQMLAEVGGNFNTKTTILAGLSMYRHRVTHKDELGNFSRFGCPEDEIKACLKMMTCNWRQVDKTRFKLFEDVPEENIARWIDESMVVTIRQPSLDVSTPLARSRARPATNRPRCVVTQEGLRALGIEHCKRCTDNSIAQKGTLGKHVYQHLGNNASHKRLAVGIRCCESRYTKTSKEALVQHILAKHVVEKHTMEAYVEPLDNCPTTPGNTIGSRRSSAYVPQSDTNWSSSYLEKDATAVETCNNNASLAVQDWTAHNGPEFVEQTSTASSAYAGYEGNSPLSAPPISRYTTSPLETTLYSSLGQYRDPDTDNSLLVVDQGASYATSSSENYPHIQTSNHHNPQPLPRLGSDGSRNVQAFQYPQRGSSANRHNGITHDYGMNGL
ncbi:hypothetical protein ACET3X_003675 [Alternaria dauci]|uniref:C2H2-type domain-containing protein n=1 Tax=Alternaria dauci TaxID=48095 RepID=A0ABR3UT45_9PLEO